MAVASIEGMTLKKRVRLETGDREPNSDQQELWATRNSPDPSTTSQSHTSSSFRNVSACNRCRQRKNKCDQNLPACSSCEKAGVKCVGFDPLTKREIPRTYVFYLENRVDYLESLLSDHGIDFAPYEDFGLAIQASPTRAGHRNVIKSETLRTESAAPRGNEETRRRQSSLQDEQHSLDKVVSNVGMVSVQGASDSRYLGSTSGISFARVVFQAVRSSVSNPVPDKIEHLSTKINAKTAAPSMRDSFFGLHSKPSTKPAVFPDRHTGLRLANLYFEHANPQIPILHRGMFMQLFDRAYATEGKERSSKEMYLLNIVYAIGAGIILEETNSRGSADTARSNNTGLEYKSPVQKKRKLSDTSIQPEEYHASAMLYLEPFLGSVLSTEDQDGAVNGLEQLQAVLLLAGFALLRPVAPGLWYIVGVAVRLAVDLGLHHEEIGGVEDSSKAEVKQAHDAQSSKIDPDLQSTKHLGWRAWIQDLRRRLWWSTYSFDRLVSTCVGRPFGISDQAITTEFPAVIDDTLISEAGIAVPEENYIEPSYKRVSHHYFRLRLLQSEIVQVLQYRQAQRVHRRKKDGVNRYMHTELSCSFLQPFASFHAWRRDIDRRLWEWKQSAPLQENTNVQFSIKFLELNYWQAVIMLYRQTLSTPEGLAGEKSPTEEMASPISSTLDDIEDEDEIYLKVAEAGQRVLKLYRQLHRVRLVNYTYLATVHLFMAGIAFLYAIWHSPTVRSKLTLDDVDFTVLAATSVLRDLVEKCPPAEGCRDAFDRMSKATIKMGLASTGFGLQNSRPVAISNRLYQENSQFDPPKKTTYEPRSTLHNTRPAPQFDMNLRALFTEETMEDIYTGEDSASWTSRTPSSISTAPQQYSQMPDLSSHHHPSLAPKQHPTNMCAHQSVTGEGDHEFYEVSKHPSDLDFLMYDGNFDGSQPAMDYDLFGNFNADGTWVEGPPMEFFDNFFFGGSSGTPP